MAMVKVRKVLFFANIFLRYFVMAVCLVGNSPLIMDVGLTWEGVRHSTER